MKQYIVCIYWSICIFFNSAHARTTTIIMALDSLCATDEKVIEKEIRSSLSIGTSIGLLFSGIPSKNVVHKQLFSLLEQIPLVPSATDPQSWKTSYIPWDENEPHPPILNQMLTSSTQKEENLIYETVINFLQAQHKLNKGRKIILTTIADFLFHSGKLNQVTQPVEAMVDLVKKLHHDGYTVILTAGVSGYGWDTFLTDYPQGKVVASLFAPSDRYISGKERLLPTSEKFYQKIMRERHLAPQECVVVGNNQHDLAYPKKIGMKTLVYNPQETNFTNFSEKLMKTIKKK
jgi:methionine salvage enolase-phosphatase E1